MKIYFAGSIRGGRDDREIYASIIRILQDYGEVLTEHIGDSGITQMGESMDQEFIFKRDMDWLKSSDFVIAEVTTPSLGVGYELGIAESLKKKVLCLYRVMPEKSLSAMVSGNHTFKVREYIEVGDLPAIFNNFLK